MSEPLFVSDPTLAPASIAMALPTILLYEAAILSVARVEKARLAREAAQGQTPTTTP